jgi:hypothetical protein
VLIGRNLPREQRTALVDMFSAKYPHTTRKPLPMCLPADSELARTSQCAHRGAIGSCSGWMVGKPRLTPPEFELDIAQTEPQPRRRTPPASMRLAHSLDSGQSFIQGPTMVGQWADIACRIKSALKVQSNFDLWGHVGRRLQLMGSADFSLWGRAST